MENLDNILPVGISSDIQNSIFKEFGENSAEFLEMHDLYRDITKKVRIHGRDYEYVLWGGDDQLPYQIANRVADNLVLSRCHYFNVLACYGQGLRFVARETKKDVADGEIRSFCLRNSLSRVFGEMVNDMKMYDCAAVALIPSKDRKQIVQVRPLEMCHCRLTKANKLGVIEHVIYGSFRANDATPTEELQVFSLLDQYDPLGDLMRRMGREPDLESGRKEEPEKCEAYAMLCAMPSAGNFYYPVPAWWAVFRDKWLDIYRLIAIGKRHLIKNTSAPRMQIEVHNDYWDNMCDLEGIMDPVKRLERKKKEKEDIVRFVTGVENAGKAMVSGYSTTPDSGKEIRMVRVNSITSDKMGGDWLEDGAEAANFLCFAMGVHPNLVGATPGKSQMNNSGSDKRELFTLKQAVEKPVQDVLSLPFHIVLHYNGWEKETTVDIPMTVLTTLDEKRDAKTVSNTTATVSGDSVAGSN